MGKEYVLYYTSANLEEDKEQISTVKPISHTEIIELYFDPELKIPAGNFTSDAVYNKDALKYDTVAMTIFNTMYTPYGTAAYNYAKINNNNIKSLTSYVAGFDDAKQMLVTRSFLPIASLDPPGTQRRKLVLASDF